MPQPDLSPAIIGIRARERVDMVGSSFISAKEESNYIESAWQEFYMELVAKHEDILLEHRLAETAANVSILELNPVAPGPFSAIDNFLKFRGLQYFENSRPGRFLSKLDVREEPLVTGGRTSRPTHYMIRTQSMAEPLVELYPTPDRTYQLRLHFIPFVSLKHWFAQAGRLRFLAGWSEILEVSVAIKMRDKEEGDCSVLLAEKARLYELLSKSLTPFDEGEPAAVVQRMPRFSIYDDPMDLEDELASF